MPERLLGDHIRLKQVLINLVKNSLKFTFKGAIGIWASYDEQAELMRIQITDTGKGVTSSEKEQLFKQFSKLARTGNMN